MGHFLNGSRSPSSPTSNMRFPYPTHSFVCSSVVLQVMENTKEVQAVPILQGLHQKQVHKLVIITRQGEAVPEAYLWEYRNGSRYAKQFGSSGASPQKGLCVHTQRRRN